MKPAVAAFVAGLLFASGLALSGMTEPARVLGFLDVAGAWNPALLFVMMGALIVYAPAYRLIRRRTQPLLDACFHVPDSRNLDAQLLLGAAVFGVGWGLSGLCPGPAIVALGAGKLEAAVTVAAMCCGSLLATFVQRKRAAPTEAARAAPTTALAHDED